ncbi:hypothetical protein C0J52_00244, partial [Blattella germanica]
KSLIVGLSKNLHLTCLSVFFNYAFISVLFALFLTYEIPNFSTPNIIRISIILVSVNFFYFRVSQIKIFTQNTNNPTIKS